MPPIRRPEERIGRTLARLAPGTLGGTLPGAARPVTPVGELRTPGGGGAGGPVMHLTGPVMVTSVDPWPFAVAGVFSNWVARLALPGTTDTVFRLLLEGVAQGSDLTIPDGDSLLQFAVTVSGSVGDGLVLQVVTAGVGAQGLVVAGSA